MFLVQFTRVFRMDQTQIAELKRAVNEDEETKAEKIQELKELFENHRYIVVSGIISMKDKFFNKF